jgi:MFS family permease
MDAAFQAVGERGRFQKILSVIILLVSCLTQLTNLTYALMTYSPTMLCKEHGNDLEPYQQCTKAQMCKPNLFDMKVDIEHSVDNFSSTFELVCERAYYAPLQGTAFFLGGMISCLFLSPIPDSYGRETLYKLLIFLALILHITVLTATSAFIIVVANFFFGIGAYAYTMSTLIITEYIDRNTAAILMSVNNAIFPITGILCALFFMFINNWRLLYFVSSCLMVLTTFVTFKYFVESPRWLSSKNKINECIDVLKRIADMNGRTEYFKKFIDANQGNNVLHRYVQFR